MIYRILRAWFIYLTGRSQAMYSKRFNICVTCNKARNKRLYKDLNFLQCSVCGCPVKTKVRDFKNNCPHPDGAKW